MVNFFLFSFYFFFNDTATTEIYTLSLHDALPISIESFDMPILINTGKDNFWIYPNNDWKEEGLGKFDIHDFRIVEELFLIDVKKVK